MVSIGIEYSNLLMSIKIKHIVLLLCLSWANLGLAQLPSTDLYLFEFKEVDSSIQISKASFLSDFNPGGYNNQVSFLDLGRIYLSTNLYNKDKTDIVELNLDENTITLVTKTSVAEYSPTPHPDGKSISTVRVETDNVTQTLWVYPQNREDGGFRLAEDFGDIGYHHWVSEAEVVLFRLPAPFTISLYNVESMESRILMDNVGRCFKSTPEGELLFVHKTNPAQWWVKKYNLETRRMDALFPTLKNSEDFEILADGRMVMAAGSQLFIRDLSGGGDWQQWYDFKNFGLNNINRIALLKNRMILTNAR
jgi:hypothetical protein